MAAENKNKVEIIPEIQGQVLKTARENMRLNPAELATKACLSKKHIIELEEGGISSFYSPAHKVRVAKKVSVLLGLDENQALVYPGSDLAKQESLRFDASPEPVAAVEAPQEVAQPKKEVKAEKTVEASAPERVVSLESIRPSYPDHEQKQPQSRRSLISIILIILVAGGLYLTKDEITQLVTPAPKPVPLSTEEMPPAEDKPAEAQASTTAATPTPTPPLPSEAGCPKADASVAAYSVTEPSKAGNFVFIQAKSKQTICVVDASGKSSLQTIEAGGNHTFGGKAPFTVLSNGLGSLSIYFQGRPVRPANEQARTIRLEEVKSN